MNVARRAVFVVDESGLIRYSWSADDPAEQSEWDTIKAAMGDLKES